MPEHESPAPADLPSGDATPDAAVDAAQEPEAAATREPEAAATHDAEAHERATSLENPAVRARIRRVLPWTLVLAAGIILLDQGSKFWAEQTLTPGERVPVIGDLIHWNLVYNPGAAFGIGGEYTWILTIVAALAVVGIAIFITRLSSVRWAIAAGALFGGAISHLGDRLFREPAFARGEIVDFIDYGVFVGNVADIALVLGAIAIVLLSLIGVSPRRPVHAHSA